MSARNPFGRRWTRGVVLATVVALASGCSSGDGGTQSPGFEIVSPGGKLEFTYAISERKAISEISGPAVIGDDRISIADFRGYVVVLNVWGSWCGPCRLEAPYLITAARDLRARGVQFLGINVRDERDSAASFEQAREVPYPSIFDPQMRSLASIRGFPVSSIPSTIVLDRQGRVARIWLRAFSGPAELVAEAAEVAAEEPAPDSIPPPLAPVASPSSSGG